MAHGNARAVELLLTFALVVSVLSSALPKPGEEDEHHDRVIDKDLSDQDHYGDENEHNPDYDREAFLGHDFKEFDELTPEESKHRLGIIYEKIDADGDGFVTEGELQSWIRHVQNKYMEEDTARQWADHSTPGDTLSWKSYKERTYGFLKDDEDDEIDDSDAAGGYSYKEMLRRDERRWKRADQDGDNILTRREFQDFLHPEDAEHMRDIVIDETIEDIDKDGDGSISLEEYVGDMWAERPEEEEPGWVTTEREQFTAFRDKDGDGKLSRDEVRDWIMPPDYDHSEAEMRHLIYESDADRDGRLTKEEVLDKYDVFVGSQATDFGEALTRHDEF